MRLSDIKGERVFEVIADVIDPISNIAEDEAARGLFRRERPPEGVSARQFAARRLKKSLPVLLKSHKEDLTAIMAAIEGTDPAAYAEALTLEKLMADVTELLTDQTVQELFTSAQSGKDDGSSTSAPESTEDTQA